MSSMQETLSEFEREVVASTGMSLPRRNRLIGRGDNSWAVRIVNYAENGGKVASATLNMAREALQLPTPNATGPKAEIAIAIRNIAIESMKARARLSPLAWVHANRERVKRGENVTATVRKMAEDAINGEGTA